MFYIILIKIKVYYLELCYEFIADKENGFVTFFISDRKLQAMIDDVFQNGGEPPVKKNVKYYLKTIAG
jgi:hypothetical protein